MAKKARRRTYRTSSERQLEEIYREIPNIPDCTGACADACGPIAMFKDEWDRVGRSFGRTPPQLAHGNLACPMLSPTGRCMVYTVRPFICRLWGTTPALACPQGCQPERWLTLGQTQEIYERLRAVAGPEIKGTLAPLGDLWEGFALEAREARQEIVERIQQRAGGTG